MVRATLMIKPGGRAVASRDRKQIAELESEDLRLMGMIRRLSKPFGVTRWIDDP